MSNQLAVGMPGLGGTLGECQLCGETFALELMRGENIETGTITGITLPVAVHKKCGERLRQGGSWLDMPDGPLRKAIMDALGGEAKVREETGDVDAHGRV